MSITSHLRMREHYHRDEIINLGARISPRGGQRFFGKSRVRDVDGEGETRNAGWVAEEASESDPDESWRLQSGLQWRNETRTCGPVEAPVR